MLSRSKLCDGQSLKEEEAAIMKRPEEKQDLSMICNMVKRDSNLAAQIFFSLQLISVVGIDEDKQFCILVHFI